MRLISILVLVSVIFSPAASANEPYQLTTVNMENLKSGVREGLFDPESARFYEIEAIKSAMGLVSVCGYVNAKNSFGGYVGKRAFFGSFRDGGFELRSLVQDERSAIQVNNMCSMFGIW